MRRGGSLMCVKCVKWTCVCDNEEGGQLMIMMIKMVKRTMVTMVIMRRGGS